MDKADMILPYKQLILMKQQIFEKVLNIKNKHDDNKNIMYYMNTWHPNFLSCKTHYQLGIYFVYWENKTITFEVLLLILPEK